MTTYTVTITATVEADEMPDPEDFNVQLIGAAADDLNASMYDESIEIEEA